MKLYQSIKQKKKPKPYQIKRWDLKISNNKQNLLTEKNKNIIYNETIDCYSAKFNIDNFKSMAFFIGKRGTIRKLFSKLMLRAKL